MPHPTATLPCSPIAIVMPLHPPPFKYAAHFADSMLRERQARCYEWHPVFSTQTDKAAFVEKFASTRANGSLILTSSLRWQPLVIRPDARNPPVSKRLHGLRMVFQQQRHDYAIGIDAESEFRAAEPFDWAFASWSARRAVLGARINSSNWRCGLQATIAKASCAAVGQPSQGYYYWWTDMPIYERRDFPLFFDAYRWDRLRYHAFCHFSYLCWKVGVSGWAIRDLAPTVPDACRGTDHLPLRIQERLSQQLNHSFAWAVGPSRHGSRLLRYHLDRRYGS